MSVAMVVPWAGNDPHRRAALGWLLARTKIPVHVGESDPDHWCKADAVAAGIAQTDAQVLVLSDADMWTPGLDEAIQVVSDGTPWATPHWTLHRLSESASADVVAGEVEPSADLDHDQRPYRAHAGGGVVVVDRDVYLDCPLDRRFVGWGQEDDAFAVALRCLHGPGWRGTADLFHLWHPPQPRKTRAIGSDASWALFRRYKAARGRPDAMRALIEEAA